MLKLSKKEVDILKFIRQSRHKITVKEIATDLGLPPSEVETFVRGMVNNKLLNEVTNPNSESAFYTNPEKREEIYNLIG
jgi:DNA-binding MarR family transcriptional regulator